MEKKSPTSYVATCTIIPLTFKEKVFCERYDNRKKNVILI